MTSFSETMSAERKRAFLAMATAAIGFAIMSACTKAATDPHFSRHPLPAAALAFYRYAGSLIFLMVLSYRSRIDLFGKDRVGLLWRGISGGIASVSFFVGIEMTSLTHAVLLNYTSIIWGTLFAFLSLREKTSKHSILALPFALLGVGLITRPEAGQIRMGDWVALLSGIVSGGALVQVRRLRKTESAVSVFFYFNLIGAPMALAVLYFRNLGFPLISWEQAPLVLGVVGFSIFAQLLMTYSYGELSTVEGGLLNLTTNIYSALIAVLFFQNALHWTTVVGGLLVLASACAIILGNRPPKIRA